MDKLRIFLWGAAGVLLWLNLVTWQHDYPQVESVAAPAISSSSAAPAVPVLPTTSASSSSVSSPDAVTTAVVAPEVSAGTKIHVVTDVLDLDINTRGGDIERASLLKYSVSLDQPDNKVQLLSDAPATLFVARSGLATKSAAAPIYTCSITL